MKKYKTLRFLVLLGPIWYLVALAYIFISRSAYPFELEFMEGGTLLHVLRLENDLPLYVEPGLDYAPFIYPPLYYYVAYVVSKITGLGWFLPLRLTSILATVGITLLMSIVARNAPGIFTQSAPPVFAHTAPLCGGSTDWQYGCFFIVCGAVSF